MPHFQSFQSPILSLQDTHVSAPFFGPNVWEGLLIPTSGGGIPANHAIVQTKFTFKEGGAFDFSTIYEQIKDSLSQAAETARESGRALREGDVDLEQLPAYEESSYSGREMPQPTPVAVTATAQSSASGIQRPTPIHPNGVDRRPSGGNGNSSVDRPAPTRSEPVPPPDGPPPGYDEVEQHTVANGLEERVKDSS